MKKSFTTINGITTGLVGLSIIWLIYDFIVYDLLRTKMLNLAPITSVDESLGMYIWIGILVFTITHIMAFIAIANQFQHFKKANILRITTLILGIISCIFILNDIACLADIGKEYAEGLEVEFEWKSLYRSSGLHGIFFIIMLANLIEAFIHKRKIKWNESVIKDEIIFTVVHAVGILCGGIGLFGTFAAFIEKRAHLLLHFTFPFLFTLTLTPYALLAGYWLAMKYKQSPKEWYDEKQFLDISRAGLLTMFMTIPFMAFHYIFNYHTPKGPIDILWFPFYLFFVILIFSVSSLYFNWKN